MKEFVNKLIGRLEEKADEHREVGFKNERFGFSNIADKQYAKQTAFLDAISIVNQLAGEYKGGWISCSERLPEKNGMYICTQNSYDLATNKNIIRVSTELVEFYNGKWRRAKNLVITHWQPLPEPPFKERDKVE